MFFLKNHLVGLDAAFAHDARPAIDLLLHETAKLLRRAATTSKPICFIRLATPANAALSPSPR
jgi:hypothetical protein